MRWLLFILSLFTVVASAQDYSGTYSAQVDPSVKLTLAQGAGGTVTGSFVGPDGQFQLEGVATPEGVGGVVYTPEGNIAFEGYLQGDILTFYLFEFGPDMEPIAETAVELLMVRQGLGSDPSPQPNPPFDGGGGSPPFDLAPTPLPVSTLTGTPLALGQQYPAGTEVVSREAGASFVVPQEFTAVTWEGSPQPALQNHARSAYALVGMQTGLSVNQVQTTLLEEQEIEGDTLRLVGAPQVQGAQFIQAYAGTRTAGYLGAVFGEGGNGVQVFLYGPMHEDAYLKSTLDALLASVRLGAPEASAEVQRWKQELPGMMLKWLSSSEGTTSSTVFNLCSDGSYDYEYNYVLSVTVPGAIGGQTEHDEHQGRWRVEAGGVGSVLVLDVNDGRVTDVGLYQTNGETYVNQTRYYLVPSETCQ